jgi:ABC-type polysaccharide/polyol phosphate export permease
MWLSRFSALVPWTFLSTGVSFGANALVTEGALIRKVSSRGIPVLGSILAAVVDFFIAQRSARHAPRKAVCRAQFP